MFCTAKNGLPMATVLLTVVMAGCGGGGGASSAEAKSLTGSVVKGPVSEAQVVLVGINPVTGVLSEEPLTSTTTGQDGEFTFDLASLSGPLVIESSGGSFIDESDQNNDGGEPRKITLSQASGFSVFRPEGVDNVSLTMLSDAMTGRALRFSTLNQVSFRDAFDAVRSITISALGFDPLTTAALNPLAPNSTDPDEIRYALLLGGLAQAANQIALRVGLAGINEEVILAVAQDLADGALDGISFGTVLQLNNQNIPDIDIAASIRIFRNNNRPAYPSNIVPVVNEALWSQAPLPSNAPPSIVSALEGPLIVNQGQSVVLDDSVLTVSDPETSSQNLAFVLLQAPTTGSISDGQAVLQENHQPVAQLHYNEQGLALGQSEAITIAVLDEGGAFSTLGLQIAVNLPPVAQDDTATVLEDGSVVVDVLANDTDPENAQLSLDSVANAVNGTVIIDGNGNAVFTPTANFNGAASFEYTIADSNGSTGTASVAVTVTAVDDSPTISDIANANTLSGTATGPISFTIGDIDSPALQVAAVSGNATLLPNSPGNISITNNNPGVTLVLTPVAGEVGSAVVTVTVDDGNSTAVDTFTLNVTAVPVEDADGDGVDDQADQCPNTPQNEVADPTGCSPSQLPLVIDGDYNVVMFGVGQNGPGAPVDTPELFSNSQFEVEPFGFSIVDGSIDGVDGDGKFVTLTRFNGGGDLFVGGFNDCLQNPQECQFTDTLTLRDDVVFASGFVEADIQDFGQGVRYELDVSPRFAYLPIVAAGTLQALVGSGFEINRNFAAADVDQDGSQDPDVIGELGSELEPLPGVLARGGLGLMQVAFKEPDEVHSASQYAGSYGYVGFIQEARTGTGPMTFEATVETLRAEMTADASGILTGGFLAGSAIRSLETGGISLNPFAAEAFGAGGSLAADTNGDPGQTILTFVESDSATIILKGALSENVSMGAFSFLESNETQETPPTDVEAEFGLLVRRATEAPALADTEFRVNMVGREFGCGFDSISANIQNARLLLDSEFTNGCGTALGASTQCYSGSLEIIDGHSYNEARQIRVDGNSFGELALDGSASEGDFVPGQAASVPAIMKVSADGLMRLDLFDTLPDPSNPGPAEDSYDGYVSVNGAAIFEGGAAQVGGQGCDFALRFIGVAVQVGGAAANTALDNRAPLVNSVNASETFPILPDSSVTLTADVSDPETDPLNFKWVARTGSFTASDTNPVGWTAPDTPSGSTVLELHVNDGLNTIVEPFEVSWGLRTASNDEKLSGELAIDSAGLIPQQIKRSFALFEPDSAGLICESGAADRVYTPAVETAGTSEEPSVGDVVTFTMSNCVVNSQPLPGPREVLVSGTWQMTVTDDTPTSYGWNVVLTDFVRDFQLCDQMGCVTEDQDTINGNFNLASQAATVDPDAPIGTNEQFDTAISIVNYSTVEREANFQNELEEIETFTIDPQSSSLTFSTWEDVNEDELGLRLFNTTVRITTSVPGGTGNASDTAVAMDPIGVRQEFDQSGNFLDPIGSHSLQVVGFDRAPLAVDWVMQVAYTPAAGIDVVVDDTQENGPGTDDFTFTTTRQQVNDADECDLTNPPAGCQPL